MNPRRKVRLWLACGVIGAGADRWSGDVCIKLQYRSLLYPGEVIYGKRENGQKPEPGQRLRIGGMVMPGSVKRDDKTLDVTFKLYDARGVVEVSYTGILPALFREGQGL